MVLQLLADTNWFYSVFKPESVSLTVLIIAAVAASGLVLGSFKIKGLSLGIPGVMFTGLVIARLVGKDKFNADVIAFVRDFGLILFVYAVGVQVGPGFLASLRKRGLPLNIMAASIVLLGAVLAVSITAATGVDIKASVGLFAGGTTNAPALGSAEEALKSIHPTTLPGGIVMGKKEPDQVMGKKEADQLTAPAFAVAYPFGLIGVILVMVVLRVIFRVKPQLEADQIEAAEKAGKIEPAALNIELANPNLHGLQLKEIPALEKTSVVVSRVLQHNHIKIATPETRIHIGDVLLAVGEPKELEDFRMIVGARASVDLRSLPSQITTRPVLVTHREALGQTVDELDLPRRLGVTITRVSRMGIEFTAVGNLRLQFGDRVRVVGEAESLEAAAKLLGDSPRELNLPRLLPIFIGILLGVFLGSLPIFVPGLPAPVKLGLASGPMIVAIILARIGRIGPVIWYMPHNASALLREFGIVLFLIAVGLNAGDGFFNALAEPRGMYWLGLGAVITFVPLLLVGLVARLFFKMHYLHVCGLLCGSMTSPSLAFTHTMTPSEAPAVSFATVYPLTMILRVLVAQLIVLVFA